MFPNSIEAPAVALADWVRFGAGRFHRSGFRVRDRQRAHAAADAVDADGARRCGTCHSTRLGDHPPLVSSAARRPSTNLQTVRGRERPGWTGWCDTSITARKSDSHNRARVAPGDCRRGRVDPTSASAAEDWRMAPRGWGPVRSLRWSRGQSGWYSSRRASLALSFRHVNWLPRQPHRRCWSTPRACQFTCFRSDWSSPARRRSLMVVAAGVTIGDISRSAGSRQDFRSNLPLTCRRAPVAVGTEPVRRGIGL